VVADEEVLKIRVDVRERILFASLYKCRSYILGRCREIFRYRSQIG